jgi:hypothetical protein
MTLAAYRLLLKRGTASDGRYGVAPFPRKTPVSCARTHEARLRSPRASPYGSLRASRAGYLCKLRGEETQPDSADGRLGAVGDLEFGDDVLYMGLHGAQADRQITCDLLVRVPLYKELQYLQLASRQ